MIIQQLHWVANWAAWQLLTDTRLHSAQLAEHAGIQHAQHVSQCWQLPLECYVQEPIYQQPRRHLWHWQAAAHELLATDHDRLVYNSNAINSPAAQAA
jgi:hypothetical protein